MVKVDIDISHINNFELVEIETSH